MTLFETIKPGVLARMNDDLKGRLSVIDEHDFSGVCRKVREDAEKQGQTVTEQQLDVGVLALKQYYAIALIDGHNMHAVAGQVDPFWHAHILHTRQYSQFCDDIAGRYLHHEPLDHSRPADVDYVKRLYEYTLAKYGECFNSFDAGLHPEDPDFCDLVCLHGGDENAIFPIYPIQPELLPTGDTSFQYQ